MKNFDWSSFTRKIAIKAPVPAIYDAWSKSAEIERWFLRDAQYFDAEGQLIDAKSNVSVGSTYKWSWYLYDYVGEGMINEANGKDYLQFTFEGCIVNIHLRQEGGWTIVELTQENIPEDDESKKNIRLGCDAGWSFYLVNLKSIYEGGIDLRNKDTALNPMLNN